MNRLVPAVLALLGSAALTSGMAPAQDGGDGERIFRTRCGSCHSVEAGQNRAGPHLAGIVGRSAGSVEEARYSRALRESGIVWGAETLDVFLTNPRRAVPGTSMTINLPNAADRSAVIAYLVGLSPQAN